MPTVIPKAYNFVTPNKSTKEAVPPSHFKPATLCPRWEGMASTFILEKTSKENDCSSATIIEKDVFLSMTSPGE